MFKKILAMVLALCLCLTFAACGGDTKTGSDDDSGESGQFTVLNNKPDDWDTNWTAYYEMDAIPKDWVKAINDWDHNEIALRGYILYHLNEIRI